LWDEGDVVDRSTYALQVGDLGTRSVFGVVEAALDGRVQEAGLLLE
jgi:hypothetical protein